MSNCGDACTSNNKCHALGILSFETNRYYRLALHTRERFMLEKKTYADTMEMLASLLAFLKQNFLNLKIVAFRLFLIIQSQSGKASYPVCCFMYCNHTDM